MAAFSAKRRLGDEGEAIARQYLAGKGYEIVESNYLKPWGEIDIVAKKGGVYHFVEVKTISREKHQIDHIRREGMTPEDNTHPQKLKKVSRTAELYMATKKLKADFQIDLVAVYLDFTNRTAQCRFYEQVL